MGPLENVCLRYGCQGRITKSDLDDIANGTMLFMHHRAAKSITA